MDTSSKLTISIIRSISSGKCWFNGNNLQCYRVNAIKIIINVSKFVIHINRKPGCKTIRAYILYRGSPRRETPAPQIGAPADTTYINGIIGTEDRT